MSLSGLKYFYEDTIEGAIHAIGQQQGVKFYKPKEFASHPDQFASPELESYYNHVLAKVKEGIAALGLPR